MRQSPSKTAKAGFAAQGRTLFAIAEYTIIRNDGDFYSLVKYLCKNNKLKSVISPYVRTCSILLKKTAKEKIIFMTNLRQKLEYIKKHR